MKELTPRIIVAELDKYIVGQDDAKRAVAVALRTRWRRRQLDEEMRAEVRPHNIMLIGPTGVGTTEIARRIASLVQAPFVKVEATKYTEVGYVGRDVESMVRDLVSRAVSIAKEQAFAKVRPAARAAAERRVLDLLLPGDEHDLPPEPDLRRKARLERERQRVTLRRQLEEGALDEREVDVAMPQAPSIPTMQVFSGQGIEEIGLQLKDALGNMSHLLGGGGPSTKSTRVSVRRALEVFEAEEAEKLVDHDAIQSDAVQRAENDGIIFIDEIDKIAGSSSQHGPDVSREGVQRDILPIVEGTTVETRQGAVRTDNILFIGAGAFHVSKPSDLVPELQGRFPVRVRLSSLDGAALRRILVEPDHSLIEQATALLATEGVTLEFDEEALDRIATLAEQVNLGTEDIGARRLHTMLDALLEDISFEASERPGTTWHVDAAAVDTRLATLTGDEDLSRYIL
jgi:ATP-dependent HslUV protease ATP-binding subunit HslU